MPPTASVFPSGLYATLSTQSRNSSGSPTCS